MQTNTKQIHKTISYKKLMKEVLLNDKVFSWTTLYEALGLNEWIRNQGYEPDVKYCYMSMRLQQYISEIFSDKYVYGKHSPYVDSYARRGADWDCVCYSPVCADVGDVLYIDLTQKTNKKKCKEYEVSIPHFEKNDK